MNKKQYDIDYQKKNIRRINLSLHRENDKDIIAYLESQTNVQGTLKRMIRKYMKEKKQQTVTAFFDVLLRKNTACFGTYLL